MTPPTPLLSVRLAAGYKQQRILEDIRFDLAYGEVFGLVGSSGEGKSTLVLALLGLLPWRGGWATGEVLFGGKNLLTLKDAHARRFRGQRIALVPQSPLSALNSAISLRTHFEQAWLAHQPSLNSTFHSRLSHLLEQVHLPSDPAFLNRRPGAVSVGQAQRAVIALALLHHPALLIADEPTSALDPANRADILALLRDINAREGTSILYISHDLLSVLQLCTRLAVLHGGRLVECLPVAHLPHGIARHPATLDLLRTLPVPVATLLGHHNPAPEEPASPYNLLPAPLPPSWHFATTSTQ